MWAHYAENHTGVCLGFTITDEYHNVKYQKNRIKFDPAHELRNPKSQEKFLNKLIKTKDKNWSYEQEYGFLEKRDELDSDGVNFYHAFNKNELELSHLILGMRSAPHNLIKYQGLLKHLNYSETIKVQQVEKSYTNYSMTTYKYKKD